MYHPQESVFLLTAVSFFHVFLYFIDNRFSREARAPRPAQKRSFDQAAAYSVKGNRKDDRREDGQVTEAGQKGWIDTACREGASKIDEVVEQQRRRHHRAEGLPAVYSDERAAGVL
jgi:hypothetical protein